MADTYQRGSIRKVDRAKGKKVWEWRYRVRGKMYQRTFACSEFPAKKDIWAHVDTLAKTVNEQQVVVKTPDPTMSMLMVKYMTKQLPELAKSTRDTDKSMLRVHFFPRWELVKIKDVHAEEVEDWIKQLKGADGKPLSPSSKGRARRLMKQLIDRAMFWRLLPVQENPIKLVRIKGVTKRQKPIVILPIAGVNKLIAAMQQPYSLMVYVAASLGLRVEEVLPLQWGDFDFDNLTLTIKRAYTHGELKVAKTDASNATLPITQTLSDALLEHKKTSKSWSARRFLYQSE
ncbi:tyrosine-type recombinase/integrase [Granulicella cerasi]|uniref:Tyrosine-type recombinase/integrase n=1 Tax=Granulicella cerasi TaxID=741063 RepID=A0ABW1Z7I2_9BACT|nr:site-specific integrase [Granulicella cerasi]